MDTAVATATETWAGAGVPPCSREESVGRRLPELARSVGGRVVLAVGAVMLCLCATLVELNHLLSSRSASDAEPWWSVLSGVLLTLAVSVPCLAVLFARPRNPIGWLLTGGVILDLLGTLTAQLGLLELHERGGDPTAGRWWAAVSESSQRPEFLLPLLVLALFPTGRSPTGRWRWLFPATACLAVVWFVAHLAGPTLDEPPFAGLRTPWHPGGATGAVLGAHVYLPLAALLGVATVAFLVTRFRRSHGVEHQQLKWLGLPLSLTPAALITLAVASLVGPAAISVAGDLAWIGAAFVLPGCVAVAIARYRLYDLDLLLNRTLVYTCLCLLIVSVYTGLVFAAAAIAVDGTGVSSPVVVAGATLISAALLTPLRRRLQDLVDRLFSRRAWAAEQILARATEQARQQRLDARTLQRALREALGDPTAVLGLRLRDRGTLVDAEGLPLSPPTPHERDLALGEGPHSPGLARVSHSTMRDHRLITAVARASGLAVAAVRLQAELDDRVAEVRRSRARLVQAADQSRRRVERDLHDGAQQHLIGLALHVGLEARRTGDPFLATVERELRQATEELRELARGLHPTALEQGLDPALRVVVARLPIPVSLSLEPARLPAAVEMTGYYVVCEALTNACRHAQAEMLAVTGERSASAGRAGYRLAVTDDGRGGATENAGHGLAGLRDRAEAVGGTLDVETRPGAGTTVSVWLPCE